MEESTIYRFSGVSHTQGGGVREDLFKGYTSSRDIRYFLMATHIKAYSGGPKLSFHSTALINVHIVQAFSILGQKSFGGCDEIEETFESIRTYISGRNIREKI